MSTETDPPDCTCEGGGECDHHPSESEESVPQMPILGPDWDTEDVDDEWEERAREQLETVDFDTELGVELSRDALRVAQGELSKAEFHATYSEEVDEEFGVDERPTKAALEAVRTANRDGDATPGVPSTETASRRRVMMALGGIAAGAATAGAAGHVSSEMGGGGSGGVAAADDGADDHDNDVQMGMAVDTDACIACLQCSLACKEENDTDAGHHWAYVFRYEDQQYGEEREGWLSRHCQHCSEPSCTWVCPTQARHKRGEDGLVLTDYDTCVGCKYCQVACPYGVNYLGKDEPTGVSDGFEGDETGNDGRTVGGPPPKGVMGKCTFCVHRQDSDDEELQGTTACEQRCPVDAIHFGDMNDPDSDPREYLRGEFDGREDVDDKNQYKLLEGVGNEPNIVYVGKEPSKNAEPIQGPTAYEDHGMQDGNYDYLDDGGEDE